MPVFSGQTLRVQFRTRDPATGLAANATGSPTGVLTIGGTDNAAEVTFSNPSTGRYFAIVTLPVLGQTDTVEIAVTATVAGVTDTEIVFRDSVGLADMDAMLAEIKASADEAARPGDAMTIKRRPA